MPTPNIPIVNQGLLYVNGLQMSPGALNADNVTTATVVIAPGQCRDSTDTNDIDLSVATTLNPVAANTGKVNGLDVGTIAIDLLYAVYVIADSTQYRPTGTLLSLNFTTPTLPFGYDMFRRVGAVQTAHAAARFTYFDQRGNGAGRDMWYAYSIRVLNGGTQTALTAFNLTSTEAGNANQVPITASKAYVFAHLIVGAGGIGHAVFSAQNTVTIANGGAIAAIPGPATGEVIMSAWTSTTVDASLVIPCTPSAGPVLPMQSFYAIDANATSLTVEVQGYQDLL